MLSRKHGCKEKVWRFYAVFIRCFVLLLIAAYAAAIPAGSSAETITYTGDISELKIFPAAYDFFDTEGFFAGTTENPGRLNNTVIIDYDISGEILGTAVGGMSVNQNVTGNVIIVNRGYIPADMYGGVTVSGGEVANNGIIINAGNAFPGVGGSIIGGSNLENNSNVENNYVTINGGNFAGFSVMGGHSSGVQGAIRSTVVKNNKVVINGGVVAASNYILGGFSNNAISVDLAILDNIIELNGGSISAGIIAGGYGEIHPSSISNNKVFINSGAVVSAKIYGGFSYLYNDDENLIFNNSITISGNADISNASLYGTNENLFWKTSGNSLNVLGFKGNVKSVSNFQNYNFKISSDINANDTMLTATDGSVSTDLDATTISIIGLDNGSGLQTGDTVTLIDASAGGITGTPALIYGSRDLFNIYDFDIFLSGDLLQATFTGSIFNPQAKALAEGRIAAFAFVNEGANLVADHGLKEALAAVGDTDASFAVFGSISGGFSRYQTGSHADVYGASLIGGISTGKELLPEGFLAGGFIEAGFGGYNSYSSFSNLPSVKGSGKTDYYGGGLLARVDIRETIYVDGSIRLGYVKSDFESRELKSDRTSVNYDSGVPYYGAHAGLGCEFNVNEKVGLDIFTKYLWTHQKGESINIEDKIIDFKDSNSSRWRLGGKAEYKFSEKILPYGGAFYEYEFDGSVRSSAGANKIEAPTLYGGTGSGEVGMKYMPAESSFSFDLSVNGFVGTRQGAAGNLTAKYKF